jgi:hypothetical protein
MLKFTNYGNTPAPNLPDYEIHLDPHHRARLPPRLDDYIGKLTFSDGLQEYVFIPGMAETLTYAMLREIETMLTKLNLGERA